MESLISIIHQLVAYSAFAAWGLGMYFWWQTNNSLKNGISKLILLNPASYFNSQNFTGSGVNKRNKAIISFAVMFVLAIIGYFLRLIKESGI